jgi:hypothetical protein
MCAACRVPVLFDFGDFGQEVTMSMTWQRVEVQAIRYSR